MSRPEQQAPPDLYYNESEAKKYTLNSRIISIQREMAERALELLALPNIHIEEGDDRSEDESYSDEEESFCEDSDTEMSEEEVEEENGIQSDEEIMNRARGASQKRQPYFILDIGVGSGLCASVLEQHGLTWLGMDISEPMLRVAQSRQLAPNIASDDSDTEDLTLKVGGGDLLLGDMGDGVPLRPGLLDGAISISALQWLCHADKSHYEPRSRLARLFTTLYAALKHGARAVFQFYPQDKFQIDLILSAALKVGFNGGLVIDYPNSTKKKKYFLVLIAGQAAPLPPPKTDLHEWRENHGQTKRPRQPSGSSIKVQDASYRERHVRKKKRHGGIVKDKDWVLKKKDLYRKRGYEGIPVDTKYTARKRRPRF